jgi:hypothetical protein
LHMSPLGKFAKKFEMLQMHTKICENNLTFCKQKLIPMHWIFEMFP